jgi:cell division protein ZapA
MSKAKPERIEVQILDRSYQLACPPEEKKLLLECVALLDTRMRQVKAQSKLMGADRIAVMAALTLARDCLTNTPPLPQQPSEDQEELQRKIAEISAKLDQALIPQERLF